MHDGVDRQMGQNGTETTRYVGCETKRSKSVQERPLVERCTLIDAIRGD